MFVLSLTLKIPAHDSKHRKWIDKTLYEVAEELTMNHLEDYKFPLFAVDNKAIAGHVKLKEVPNPKPRGKKKPVVV